jgi:hypothetical protein
MSIILWTLGVLGWIAAGTVTSGIIYRQDPESWQNDRGAIDDGAGWYLVLFAIVWPISATIGLCLLAVRTSPSERKEAKRALARRLELEEEQHRTALAQERVKQAEALETEYRVLGLSDRLSEMPE